MTSPPKEGSIGRSRKRRHTPKPPGISKESAERTPRASKFNAKHDTGSSSGHFQSPAAEPEGLQVSDADGDIRAKGNGKRRDFRVAPEELKQLKERDVDTLQTDKNFEENGFTTVAPGKRTCMVSYTFAEEVVLEEGRTVASSVKVVPKKKAPKDKGFVASAVLDDERIMASPVKVVPKMKAPKDKCLEASATPEDPIIDEASTSVGPAMPTVRELKKKKSKEDAWAKFLKQKLVDLGDAPNEDLVDVGVAKVPSPAAKLSKSKRNEAQIEVNKLAHNIVVKGDSLFSGLPEFDFSQVENAMMASEDPFQHLHERFEYPHSKEETEDWEKTVTLAMHKMAIPFVKKVLSGAQRPLEDFALGHSRNHVPPSELVELLGHATSEVDYHMKRAANMYDHAYQAKKALTAELARVEDVMKEQDKVLKERDDLLAKVEALERDKARSDRAKERAEKAKEKAEKKRDDADLKLFDAKAKLKAIANQPFGNGGAGEMPIGMYKFWLQKHNDMLNQPICFKFERAFGGPFKVQVPTLPSGTSAGESSEDDGEEGDEEINVVD